MAETPDEVYDRTLAEEQAKGSSPQVAQARAKAARMRASKGLSTSPAAAAREAASGAKAPAPEPAAPAAAAPAPAAAGEAPEAAYERVLAEEQAKGSSPAVAQARAKAARMRAQKGTAPSVPVGAGVAGRVDHPVDDTAAEQRMEVLGNGRAHPRAEPAGHHHCCEFA